MASHSSLSNDFRESLNRQKQAIWEATSSGEERQRLWTECKANMQSYLDNDAIVGSLASGSTSHPS